MPRRYSLLFVLFLGIACATGSSRPKHIAQPDIDARMPTNVFFGSSSTAPVAIEVTVTNRATSPIAVRRVELESTGMAEWGIRPASRAFNETLAPAETRAMTVFATAETTVRRPSESLTIRAIVEFEAGKERWIEFAIARQ